jgi:hypothetical protein
MNKEEQFKASDFFTYSIKNNKILSGGYEINSTLLKKQIPLLGMDRVNGLAIPVGLLHLSQNSEKESLEEIYEEDPLQDTIYDKLLKLMNEPVESNPSNKSNITTNKKQKHKTRKVVKKKSRNTKKNTNK